MRDWLQFEQAHVWHPYAPMQGAIVPYPVKSASGVRLHFHDGRSVIDGMSSWWCAIHGYNVPELNQAIEDQLKDMAHVMFGGLTHEPAARLAEILLRVAPPSMNHVFFADSGSVSVEVAIKMAMQYWMAQGRPEKNRLLTLRHGYHGDTFGAMSVCDPVSGMHHLFSSMLADQLFADVPSQSEEGSSKSADFCQLIDRHHHEIAAVILEPLVQGAGGMRFYAPAFLSEVRQLCDHYDVLLIADEIATGFGRTGTMFACEQAAIEPDILCVGKALTGGYMSMAATICTSKVCQGIHQSDEASVLMHGPTFMANPLACAVSYASLKLLIESPWQQRVSNIESTLRNSLAVCSDHVAVEDVRVTGAIGVIEMKDPVDVAKVQAFLIKRGVWLRPFGKLIYAMPAYVMNKQDLTTLTQAMCAVVDA